MKKTLSICNCNLGCPKFDAQKTGENIRRVREYIKKTYYLSRKDMVHILSGLGWELDEASLGNWERGDRNISLENLCRLVVFFSLVCRDDPNAPPHTFDGLVVFASDREFDGERDQPVPVKYILLLKRVFALCNYSFFLRMDQTYVLKKM